MLKFNFIIIYLKQTSLLLMSSASYNSKIQTLSGDLIGQTLNDKYLITGPIFHNSKSSTIYECQDIHSAQTLLLKIPKSLDNIKDQISALGSSLVSSGIF